MTAVIRTPSPEPGETATPCIDPDEFRQIVLDVARSRQALAVLANLLHAGGAEVFDAGRAPGLAVLLESSTQRLQMALDGLLGAATALQIEGVRELTTDR